MKLIFPLLLMYSLTYGQNQEQKVLIYNIGFGSLTSGIGAIINKPKQGNWKACFLKGIWQGGIGGVLHYTSKKTLCLVNKEENLIYAWPAKLLHHAGSSIIENAALNEPFLQNWNLDFGPIRFDFSISGSKPFRMRLLPYSIYSTIAGSRNGQFDFSTTLLTGNMSFRSNHWWQLDALGLSYGRAYGYVDDEEKYHTISHELVHQFQFNEYQVFNSWLNSLGQKVKSEKVQAVFKKYIYMDLPYFVPFYKLEGEHEINNFYKNFYEFEAQRFSTNRYVPIK